MKIFKVPETISWSLSLSGEWTSLNWPGRVVRIKSNVFFYRVGKCTICSKPWSFIMSINICPSDWLNVEPDLLSLSGQSISLKLKSPRTWTEGRASLNNSISILLVWRKMFKDERYAREKRVRYCFRYWSWIEQRWKESEVIRKLPMLDKEMSVFILIKAVTKGRILGWF